MPSLEELESRAKALVAARNWGGEAIRVNTAILELDDRNCAAYNRLGRCYMESGRYEAARGVYEQVLALAPEGNAARSVATGGLRKLKELRAAQPVTNGGRQIRTYEEAFAAGQAAKSRQDYPTAAAAFRRACELKLSVYALNALAATYREMGHLDTAEQTYRRALGLRDNPVSWVGLAGVRRAQGRPEEAVEILLRITAQHPSNAHAWQALAGAYADLNLSGRATACSQRAWVIEHRSNRGRRSRGRGG